MKVALLATEAGRGLGHIKRLAGLAGELRARGWRSILATFRHVHIEQEISLFDEILPAPAWPGLQNETEFLKAHDPNIPATSFASMLSHLGAADPDVIRNHLLMWGNLLARINPDVVIGDYAPGCMLAASGRVKTMAVGTGFSVPALCNGRFVPFRDAEDADAILQDRLLDAVTEGCRAAGHTPSGEVFAALRGDVPFPVCFRILDCAKGRRLEPLLPPYIPLPRDGALDANQTGRQTFIYLGPDIRLFVSVLEAIAAVATDPVLYAPTRSNIPPGSFQRCDRPFSFAQIAGRCDLFVHHGGLGVTQLCAAAGIPQLILYHDVEKWLNAEVINKAGAGVSIHLRLANAENVTRAVQALRQNPAYKQAAARLASEVWEERSQMSEAYLIADAITAS